MAITVNLLTFNKRENSTKVPTPTQIAAGASYSCILLESTSLMSPTFKLSIASNPIAYNYCYVSDFNRYYFVNDITSDNNFWYVSCSCDVLASFKTEVLAGSHYVLRSASSYDEYIGDSAYITKVKQTGTRVTGSVDGTTATDPFSYSNGHSYVWCITGDVIDDTLTNQQIGSNVYYWMDDRECYTLINYLLDVQEYSDIQPAEYSVAMQKALLNPMQYVNAVILLPFSKNATLATNNHVKFGYYDILLEDAQHPPAVKRLTQGTMLKTQNLQFTIPKHPQASTYGKYMNAAPYTEYSVFLGPFGNIPLDPASLVDETTLQVTCQTECCTGQTRIFIRGLSTGAPMIYSGIAQTGAPVAVSQLTRDMLGEIQNNLNIGWSKAAALTSIATGGIGAAGNTLNSVQSIGGMAFDAIRLKYPTCAGGGSNGSFLSFHSSCYLEATYYTCTDRNTTEIGRPLHQTKILNTLTGFCLCQGADAIISGTAEEVTKVNGYLNSGFFIE